MKIGLRMIITLVPIIVLINLIAFGLFYNDTRQVIYEDTQLKLMGSTEHISNMANLYISNTVHHVSIFATDPRLPGFIASNDSKLQEDLNSDLRLQVDVEEAIDSMGIMDLSGTIIASNDDATLGKNFANREYFQKTIETKEYYLTGAMRGTITKNLYILSSCPIKGQTGSVVVVS